MSGGPHSCRFRRHIEWSSWVMEGAFSTREGRTRAQCAQCGRIRAARRALPPDIVEREAPLASRVALDEDGRRIARDLLRRARAGADRPIKARGFNATVRRRGIAVEAAETWIEKLASTGSLRVRERRSGNGWQPTQYFVVRPDHLEEIIAPGSRAQHASAVDEARRAVGPLVHPVAGEVARVLESGEAAALSIRVIRALAAIAQHAESGDVLSANVFSARYLGSAKELRRIRRRMERIVGNLDALGVRDGAALLVIGGAGTIALAGQELRIEDWSPYVAIAREAANRLQFRFPPAGVMVVENLAVFEALCRREVRPTFAGLLVWSAGYPSRAVRVVVESARAASVTVQVWGDLDLDGVRIARLIHSWAPEYVSAFRMGSAELQAPIGQPLSDRARTRIEADLEANPDAPLADTLRELLRSGVWVEQEALLGDPQRA